MTTMLADYTRTTTQDQLKRLKKSHGFRTLHTILETIQTLIDQCRDYEENHPGDCQCVHCQSEPHVPWLVDGVQTLRGVAEMVQSQLDSGLRSK